MASGLRVWSGGSGEPLVLFLHGLGATGDVWKAWRPWLEQQWPGQWMARYLRVSGIATLLGAESPAIGAGLLESQGRWRLAADPGAFAVGAPDMTRLLAQAQAPVTLARGENDPMNTDEQLARLGVPAVTLRGAGPVQLS